MTTTFAKRLRAARLARGLTAGKVASQCGMHVVSVYRLEKGARQPSLATARKLADFLGFSIS